MSNAAAFRATYSDFRLIKSRKVVQFVFELPLEEADTALKVVGGMPNPGAEIWCAVARLNPEAIAPEPKARAHRPVDPDKRLAQRAGILSNDPVFWRYVESRPGVRGPIVTAEQAAGYIRAKCQVESRADILLNTEAALRFDLLESAFVCWRDEPDLAEAAE